MIMKTIKSFLPLFILVLLISNPAWAQQETTSTTLNSSPMKTYVIEREIPNAGKLTPEDLKKISKTSNNVLDEMGKKRIEWIESYVTDDKIFCVYKADSKETIAEHAKKGGFPANSIRELSAVINPETGKN